MPNDPLLLVYALPLFALWWASVALARRRSLRAEAILEDSRQAGLTEPASLHPVIDAALCLGCASCARACPEGRVLGIIDGKAALIEPTSCIGHGACAAACPTGAIRLVFGTATRGVDIPLLTPDFETTVPGVYIAGELGGMGLIRNAIEQGSQAMDAIASAVGRIAGAEGVLDVVIVGCGPAGISASLGAIQHKLRFVTIDQASLGGTVAHFPRGKVVMTAPAKLPLIGEVRFGEISKEKLLAFWTDVLRQTGLHPKFEEQVTAIAREGSHLVVTTAKGQYRSKCVLLAIGRRGTPRTLDVPGEELEKVVYRLIDPEQFAGKHVLVVGGGDSALEAAVRIAEQPGTQVTISYRGNSYGRARQKNRDSLREQVASGTITELLESTVQRIEPARVVLRKDGEEQVLENDAVIVCAGGLLPTDFLDATGIRSETKFGTV